MNYTPPKYKVKITGQKLAAGTLWGGLAIFAVDWAGPWLFGGDSWAENVEARKWAIALVSGAVIGVVNAARNFVKHKWGVDIPVIT